MCNSVHLWKTFYCRFDFSRTGSGTGTTEVAPSACGGEIDLKVFWSLIMGDLKGDENKIVQENADLIHLVIMSIFEPGYIPHLETNLVHAESNGWNSLVAAIRKLLSGERDISKLSDLDDEDKIIITSILQGIETPETLPELTNTVNSDMAGPQIAHLIHSVSSGDENSNTELNEMISQMASCGGDLARISSIIGILVQGERDRDALCVILDGSGITLMDEILNELSRLEK